MHSITSVPLADIARTTPASTRVFMRHHLDFCCGGKRTLAEACELAGLDPVVVAAEVEQEARKNSAEPDWLTRPAAELCDYIETRFHAALRRDLPLLIEAAIKVERVHVKRPEVPTGLAALLADMLAEMEHHMGKEEQVLFPMIRRGVPGERMYMPVSALESEHDIHGQMLTRIRELTNDFQVPERGCATWRALYQGLEAMEDELMHHIHLENNILFPRAVR